MKILVLTPTYNEAENIRQFVKAVLAAGPVDLLIVDDSSPDGTGKIVDELRLKYPRRLFVLHRPKKQGLGAALLAGFRWAVKRPYRFVISMDADFSHDPRYLAGLINQPAHLDVVIGSRYVPGGGTKNWDLKRKIYSKIANAFAKILLRLPVHDATAGFKRYSSRFLRSFVKLPTVSSGYTFQVETVLVADRAGFSLTEIPIIFTDRRVGQSKIAGEAWRSGKEIIKLFLNHRLTH